MNLVLLMSAIALFTGTIRCQLLSIPMNTIATFGQRVEFECSTNLTLPLRWDFAAVNSTRFEFIYLNEKIHTNFSSRYKVDTLRRGHWTLVIDSADMSNAGTYRCLTTPNYPIGEKEMSASAQLIVIDSDPLCGTNASNSGVVEGDYIRMWCTFSYSENWIPVGEWTRNNGQTVDADIHYSYESRKVTSSLITQFASSDNGVTFTLKMSLNQNATKNIPGKVGETQATNIPHYRYSWNYTATVLYGPHNLVIEPNSGIYEVGDRVVCSADGNPSPHFQWTTTGTNRVMDGPILTIDKTMAMKQKLIIKCTASNTVSGKSESISENVTFAITETSPKCIPATIALTVSGVIGVVGLIALGLGVALTMKACAKVKREKSQESSVQREDYEMVDESNMKSGEFGKMSLNQTTSKKEGTEHNAAETIPCEGYASLKRGSLASFAEPAVYAELQQYANTSNNND